MVEADASGEAAGAFTIMDSVPFIAIHSDGSAASGMSACPIGRRLRVDQRVSR
jgi:hypothetical protein